MPERHPETENLLYTCPRCGTALNPNGAPVETNAVYYVEAGVERNPLVAEMAVALAHSDKTRSVRDAMKSEHDLTTAEANMALAREDAIYAPKTENVNGTPPDPDQFTDDNGNQRVMPSKSHYDRREDVDPTTANADPDVIQVVAEELEIDQPAYLLIDEDCLEDGDSVLWAGAPLT